MRCAIYSRVSTEDQAREGYSLDSQRRALNELAVERGYTVVFSATDDVTGAVLDRSGLTRIRDAARAKQIDAVLVFDPDRLSRKLAHLMILQDEFEREGVALEFVNQPAAKTQEDRLLLNVRGVIAEYEREKIRERVQRGRLEKARKGLVCATPSPFGYSYQDGRLIIDAKEAPVVQRMFERMATGTSLCAIQRELEAGEVPPRRGGRWQRSSISRILGSELYIGKGWYNRRKGTGRGWTWRPADQWVALAVPAIVSKDLFNAAQSRLSHNKEVLSGRPSRAYMLKGLLRCSCGHRMGGMWSKGERYYRCRHCSARSIRADAAEPAVWKALAQAFGTPDVLASRLAKHVSKLQDGKQSVGKLERKIAHLRRREENAVMLLMDAAMSEHGAMLRSEIEKARAQRAQLTSELAALQSVDSVLADVEATRMDIARRLRRIAESPELRREFLLRIVDRIDVSDTRLTISCKLSITVAPCGQFSFGLTARIA